MAMHVLQMVFALAIFLSSVVATGSDAWAESSGRMALCGPPQAKTLIADSDARFFLTGGRNSDASPVAVYGCTKDGSNRRIGPVRARGKIWASGIKAPLAIEGTWLGATEHRLIGQDAAEWDRQMEEDFSPSGAGMALLEEVEADVRSGRVKSMDEFLTGTLDKRSV